MTDNQSPFKHAEESVSEKIDLEYVLLTYRYDWPIWFPVLVVSFILGHIL